MDQLLLDQAKDVFQTTHKSGLVKKWNMWLKELKWTSLKKDIGKEDLIIKTVSVNYMKQFKAPKPQTFTSPAFLSTPDELTCQLHDDSDAIIKSLYRTKYYNWTESPQKYKLSTERTTKQSVKMNFSRCKCILLICYSMFLCYIYIYIYIYISTQHEIKFYRQSSNTNKWSTSN